MSCQNQAFFSDVIIRLMAIGGRFLDFQDLWLACEKKKKEGKGKLSS